ncbi:MAG: DUF4493 domain-containing protein [Bacteroidales bacterium]|nr:DUF4493 domain-containing protein [Bacteroidales bacterium]
MKKIFTLISSVVVLAVSCNKAEIDEGQKGMGILSMDMSIDPQTRAMTEAELYNSAQVNIYKADFSGLVRSYTYSDMPSTLYLAADEYRVDVEAGESVAANPVKASWDSKSYKGSKAFTIVADVVTNVEVEANVNNAVTCIGYDATVAENFNPGYTLTIGLDADDASTQLVYDASKSGAEGYFIVTGLDEPSFTWTFSGTLAKDGSAFTKTGTISGIEPGKIYKMNLKYTIKDGDLGFTLMVDYTTEVIDDTIIFEPVSTGLASTPVYEIWAAHATVHADVDPTEYAGSVISFEYSSDGSVWNEAAGINDSEGTWKAVLTGLTPATEYRYRLMIDGVQTGEEKTLTTDVAPKLPNGSFEYVSKVSGKSYYKFYDPNCGVDEGSYMFWGSGNGEGSEGVNGSANLGIVITDVDQSDKVDGTQSILCMNDSMIGMLTAGNLFTGQFAGLVNTDGGKVNFGRPWTSRPTALKIWCKYSTGKINILKNENLGVTTNDYDRAQIKFAIGTWNYKDYGGTKDCPVQVNTTKESTFVDFYTDANTIANGDLIIYNDGYMVNKGAKVNTTTSGWIEYTIPLEYRQLTTYPTHIIISCATSQFGDYFTGYDGAKLWIDAAELIYE